MNVLPLQTRPPTEAVARGHAPPRGGFNSYRRCLRWEFGFTCAFCLLHEADLVDWGASGSGLMTIEHRVPQSDPAVGAALADDYGNCFYACRYCNRSRGVAPLV